MFDNPLTLYKLIILYMLNRASFPLTVAQISDFILDKDYTTFLTLQQGISDLKEAEMITSHSIGNRTHLTITPEGEQTLHYFENRITDAIKNDVIHFLKENEITLRNEVSVQGDYYKSTTGEYEARLVAKERGINLVDITLSVPTEEMAASICDNWQMCNQEVYQALVKLLF